MKSQGCAIVRENLISALFLESRKEVVEKKKKPGLSPVSGGWPLKDFELPGLCFKDLLWVKCEE